MAWFPKAVPAGEFLDEHANVQPKKSWSIFIACWSKTFDNQLITGSEAYLKTN